jgi:hypothetical protein
VLPEIRFNEPYSYFPDSLSRQFVNRGNPLYPEEEEEEEGRCNQISLQPLLKEGGLYRRR